MNHRISRKYIERMQVTGDILLQHSQLTGIVFLRAPIHLQRGGFVIQKYVMDMFVRVSLHCSKFTALMFHADF